MDKEKVGSDQKQTEEAIAVRYRVAVKNEKAERDLETVDAVEDMEIVVKSKDAEAWEAAG